MLPVIRLQSGLNIREGNSIFSLAKYTKVRNQLLELQRKMAKTTDVIMDGRDIGTVVLPDAEAKIFLTAGSRVRAERRFKELQEKGVDCNIDEIEKDIIARDEQDMNREIAPLRQAEDAVYLDTSRNDYLNLYDKYARNDWRDLFNILYMKK